jgi:hypothetical protein
MVYSLVALVNPGLKKPDYDYPIQRDSDRRLILYMLYVITRFHLQRILLSRANGIGIGIGTEGRQGLGIGLEYGLDSDFGPIFHENLYYLYIDLINVK